MKVRSYVAAIWSGIRELFIPHAYAEAISFPLDQGHATGTPLDRTFDAARRDTYGPGGRGGCYR